MYDIISEFNNLGVLAQKLEDTGRYDVGVLISGLKHLLVENNFFYGTLADNHPDKDPRDHPNNCVNLRRGVK